MFINLVHFFWLKTALFNPQKCFACIIMQVEKQHHMSNDKNHFRFSFLVKNMTQ